MIEKRKAMASRSSISRSKIHLTVYRCLRGAIFLRGSGHTDANPLATVRRVTRTCARASARPSPLQNHGGIAPYNAIFSA
jgi:hypothetical protein